MTMRFERIYVIKILVVGLGGSMKGVLDFDTPVRSRSRERRFETRSRVRISGWCLWICWKWKLFTFSYVVHLKRSKPAIRNPQSVDLAPRIQSRGDILHLTAVPCRGMFWQEPITCSLCRIFVKEKIYFGVEGRSGKTAFRIILFRT